MAAAAVSRSPSVAVIGAGMAGLACAAVLQRAGINVRVYDKGRSPGGRSCTRRPSPSDPAKPQFDHGAQYTTATHPAFTAQLDTWLRDGTSATWTPAPVTLTTHGKRTPIHAEPAWYVGVPTMAALANSLARSLPVHCGVQVGRLIPDGSRFRLGDSSGADLDSFDAVALTCPPPQTASLLTGIPALASLAQSVSGVAMAPCWTVMAAFAAPVPADFQAAVVEVTDSPLAWIARDSSKPGRPASATDAWVLQASAQWSRAHLEEEAPSVQVQLLDAFGKVLDRTLPSPSFASAHRWRYARPERALAQPCLLHPQLAVGVAGDWCDATGAGRRAGGGIEAAYLSGTSLAEQLRQRLLPIS